MEIRGLKIFLTMLILLSCAAITSADSSGNINIELTKLEPDYGFILYIFLAAFVVVILSLSIILLKRRRTARPRLPKKTITVTRGSEGFKQDGYYGAVFNSSKSKVELSDEKQEEKPIVSTTNTGGIDRYLKEDERIVLNVLRLKHNSCTQATLRIATDFSKAKLSRILSELEERGVIFKEQQGRKNLITLRE